MSDLSDPTTWEPKKPSAFEQGKAAHLSGRPITENPYEFEAVHNLWSEWRSGWVNAARANDKPYDFAKAGPMTQKQFETEMDAVFLGRKWEAMKPHIWFDRACRRWVCSNSRRSKAGMIGWTPLLAYRSWEERQRWTDINGYAKLVAKRLQGESL